jgi:hypothetical protein
MRGNRPPLVKLCAAVIASTTLIGCRPSESIDGQATTPTSVTQEQLGSTLEAQFNETGQYLARVVSCVAAGKNSGTTNPEKNRLSNWASVTGPDGVRYTSDDRLGPDPVGIEIERREELKGIDGSWDAEWQSPEHTEKASPTLRFYVKGFAPIESEFGTNRHMPGGGQGLGPEQALAGASDVKPALMLLQNNESPTPFTTTLERRGNQFYYTPLGSKIEQLTAEQLSREAAAAKGIGGRLLLASGVDQTNCNLN